MASPLLVASQGGHFEVVQVLIEAAADLDKATSSTGFTSLLVASQKGHSEVVRLLIAAGADKEKSSNGAGITPLIMASQRGHLEVVRLLVEAGADKEKATKAKSDEATPLLMASQENRLEVVRCLIQAGADKNKASAVTGITPLLMAAQRNHLDVARVLLEARADLEIGSQDGMTPLLASCAQGHLKMVQLLLEHADVDDPTTDTAASMALEAGHVDVEEFLHQLEGKKRRKVEDGVRWFIRCRLPGCHSVIHHEHGKSFGTFSWPSEPSRKKDASNTRDAASNAAQRHKKVSSKNKAWARRWEALCKWDLRWHTTCNRWD